MKNHRLLPLLILLLLLPLPVLIPTVIFSEPFSAAWMPAVDTYCLFEMIIAILLHRRRMKLFAEPPADKTPREKVMEIMLYVVMALAPVAWMVVFLVLGRGHAAYISLMTAIFAEPLAVILLQWLKIGRYHRTNK